MTLTIDTQTTPRYVELSASGHYSLDEALNLLDHAFCVASANDRTAALIDIRRVDGNPDQLEGFEIGRNVPELQLGKDRLIALAMLVQRESLNSSLFLETVAVNRCAVFKVFDDKDAAIRWLENASV